MVAEKLLWVCVAGGVGSGARYLIGLGALRALGGTFPFGTLIVNVAGCLLMGAVAEAAARGAPISPTAKLSLTTGFLGGLTTYSTFNAETTQLLVERTASLAALNAVLTALLCLGAGLLGAAAARLLW